MDLKKEIKYIKDLSKVLDVLAKEVEKKGKFEKEDMELLKKVGSSILFQGSALGWME